MQKIMKPMASKRDFMTGVPLVTKEQMECIWSNIALLPPVNTVLLHKMKEGLEKEGADSEEMPAIVGTEDRRADTVSGTHIHTAAGRHRDRDTEKQRNIERQVGVRRGRCRDGAECSAMRAEQEMGEKDGTDVLRQAMHSLRWPTTCRFTRSFARTRPPVQRRSCNCNRTTSSKPS